MKRCLSCLAAACLLASCAAAEHPLPQDTDPGRSAVRPWLRGAGQGAGAVVVLPFAVVAGAGGLVYGAVCHRQGRILERSAMTAGAAFLATERFGMRQGARLFGGVRDLLRKRNSGHDGR